MALDVPLQHRLTGSRQRGASSKRARRRHWALGIAALTLALSTFLLAWLLARPGRESTAIESMPATERAALFERTLTNVSTVCVGQQARELHQFCSSEAKLLVKFPECDASCRALAEPHLTQPTR